LCICSFFIGDDAVEIALVIVAELVIFSGLMEVLVVRFLLLLLLDLVGRCVSSDFRRGGG
jgi:hypothetical protein